MYLASEKATFSAVAETVSILLFAIPYIDTCQINNIIPKRLNPLNMLFVPYYSWQEISSYKRRKL